VPINPRYGIPFAGFYGDDFTAQPTFIGYYAQSATPAGFGVVGNPTSSNNVAGISIPVSGYNPATQDVMIITVGQASGVISGEGTLCGLFASTHSDGHYIPISTTGASAKSFANNSGFTYASVTQPSGMMRVVARFKAGGNGRSISVNGSPVATDSTVRLPAYSPDIFLIGNYVINGSSYYNALNGWASMAFALPYSPSDAEMMALSAQPNLIFSP
jgi:hypothetical protein